MFPLNLQKNLSRFNLNNLHYPHYFEVHQNFLSWGIKEHDFSDYVVVVRTLINPLETKARPPIDHCLQCISGGCSEVAVGSAADLCGATAA